MKLIFLHLNKHQSFYKLALCLLMEEARHVKTTQNWKLEIFLQFLKKKDFDKVYFLHADKHESFLPADIDILSVFS